MVCALVLHHLCLLAGWLPWSTRTGKLELKLGKSMLVSGAIFINHRLTEVGRDLGDHLAQAFAQSRASLPVHQAAQDLLQVSSEDLQGRRSPHTHLKRLFPFFFFAQWSIPSCHLPFAFHSAPPRRAWLHFLYHPTPGGPQHLQEGDLSLCVMEQDTALHSFPLFPWAIAGCQSQGSPSGFFTCPDGSRGAPSLTALPLHAAR